MKIASLITAFALLASMNLYAGAHAKKERRDANCEYYAPHFQNHACGGWWAETQSLFNGDSGSSHKACGCKKSKVKAPLFQNQPCRGWIMDTRSLFNG